jgi:hypothetical protein
MKKLGCLVVFVVLLVAAWITRATWMTYLPRRLSSSPTRVADTGFHPLTLEGAARARAAMQSLSTRDGPDSVMVTPADLASYIFQELSRSLPASADSIQAAAVGDRLYLSAVVRTADLGASIGPLGALLGERERVTLGGTLRIVRPGLAELDVKEIKIKQLSIPSSLIPKIIQQISRDPARHDLAPDGLPLRTPAYVGDVHVWNGTVTVYRARTNA